MGQPGRDGTGNIAPQPPGVRQPQQHQPQMQMHFDSPGVNSGMQRGDRRESHQAQQYYAPYPPHYDQNPGTQSGGSMYPPPPEPNTPSLPVQQAQAQMSPLPPQPQQTPSNPNQPPEFSTADALLNEAQRLRVAAAQAQTRVKEIQDSLLSAIDAASTATDLANAAQARANEAMAALTTSMTLPPAGGHYSSFEELLAAAQEHARNQGYALSAGRRRKRKDGRRSLIEVICARGGSYRDSVGGERKRRVSTRKTGCTFSFNAAELWEGEEEEREDVAGTPKKEREVGPGKTFWEIRYKDGSEGRDCGKHNHLPEWEEGKVGKWGNKREISKAKRQKRASEGGAASSVSGTPMVARQAQMQQDDGDSDEADRDAEGSREVSMGVNVGPGPASAGGTADAQHEEDVEWNSEPRMQGQETRGIGMYQPPYYGPQ